jgi:hypothetical protein
MVMPGEKLCVQISIFDWLLAINQLVVRLAIRAKCNMQIPVHLLMLHASFSVA